MKVSKPTLWVAGVLTVALAAAVFQELSNNANNVIVETQPSRLAAEIVEKPAAGIPPLKDTAPQGVPGTEATTTPIEWRVYSEGKGGVHREWPLKWSPTAMSTGVIKSDSNSHISIDGKNIGPVNDDTLGQLIEWHRRNPVRDDVHDLGTATFALPCSEKLMELGRVMKAKRVYCVNERGELEVRNADAEGTGPTGGGYKPSSTPPQDALRILTGGSPTVGALGTGGNQAARSTTANLATFRLAEQEAERLSVSGHDEATTNQQEGITPDIKRGASSRIDTASTPRIHGRPTPDDQSRESSRIHPIRPPHPEPQIVRLDANRCVVVAPNASVYQIGGIVRPIGAPFPCHECYRQCHPECCDGSQRVRVEWLDGEVQTIPLEVPR